VPITGSGFNFPQISPCYKGVKNQWKPPKAKPRHFICLRSWRPALVIKNIGVNPGELEVATLQILGWEVVRSPWNIIIFCHVAYTEIWDENTFQSGDFSEIVRFVYIKSKFRWCYPNSCATRLRLLNCRTQDPPFFKPGLTIPPFSKEIDAADQDPKMLKVVQCLLPHVSAVTNKYDNLQAFPKQWRWRLRTPSWSSRAKWPYMTLLK